MTATDHLPENPDADLHRWLQDRIALAEALRATDIGDDRPPEAYPLDPYLRLADVALRHLTAVPAAGAKLREQVAEALHANTCPTGAAAACIACQDDADALLRGPLRDLIGRLARAEATVQRVRQVVDPEHQRQCARLPRRCPLGAGEPIPSADSEEGT